ncbi:MAG: DNA helicase RecQ [Spirochaetes bacterium]|nr:DNA helicase RecQ [Spirochaetota bacterium]
MTRLLSVAPAPALVYAPSCRGVYNPPAPPAPAVRPLPTPESILKETFGYDSFRPLQREIIEHVLARRDALAILPTGGGKSLCYQVPALIFPGLTIVVSPLIALMKDQVEQLRAAGVPALFLNSTLSPEEYGANMRAVRQGEVKLLYMAPETLVTARIESLLSGLSVDCLTIDEAHCISEWGHDFRPEYREIAAFRERFPNAACLALTATATVRVREDIKRALKLAAQREFIASFDRENLFIEVQPKTETKAQLLEFLSRFPGESGIIYGFSRKRVDELSAFLASRGHAVRPYHAGLEDEARRKNQEAFIRDDAQVMVATIAFGMGINKPDVRFVVHVDLPKSLENYYQEIGRAGRDGLPAHCLLLYTYGDVAKIRHFIDQKTGDEKQVAAKHLEAMVRFAEDTASCRRKPLLAYFGEAYEKADCGRCDHCAGGAQEPVDITVPAQKFLSCVVRTGGRFGAFHVTEVLLGSRSEKVLKWGHEKLSTWGIGAEYDKKQWMELSQELVRLGLLTQEGEYRILVPTPKAQEVLRERTPLFGRLPGAARPASARSRTRSGAPKGGEPLPDFDPGLFDLLRKKRKSFAEAASVPPYVIFSDRSLMEMAGRLPRSPEAFLRVHGVGQVKAEKYGQAFLSMIHAWCQENGRA